MALRPVARRLVPDDVFDQLLDEVVDGDLSPGDALPSERRLAEMLGVSRPAVREALQRMSATRLVEVRHGGATTVRDFTRHGGLDLLARLLVRGGRVDPGVGRSIVEARLAIGPVVAALAAERRGPERAAAFDRVTADLADAPDPRAAQIAALGFWDLVTETADSITFRLMFNSLRLAYEPAVDVLAPLLGSEVENAAAYRSLAGAITSGDPEAARRLADDLLRPATHALLDLLSRMEAEDD